MAFVANFIHFPAVQNFENRLRFDKVTESLTVGTFVGTQCRVLLYKMIAAARLQVVPGRITSSGYTI